MVLLLLLLLVVGVAEAAELVDDAEVDTFVDVEEVGFLSRPMGFVGDNNQVNKKTPEDVSRKKKKKRVD